MTLRNHVALYRIKDSEGGLLYVGQSRQPWLRLNQHIEANGWATRIASIDVEWHESRAAAQKAERQAIKSENPEINIAMHPKHGKRERRNFGRIILRRWMKASGTSVDELSTLTGLKSEYLDRVLSGAVRPSWKTAGIITGATFGEVPQAIWACDGVIPTYRKGHDHAAAAAMIEMVRSEAEA